jgi:hypothetical protein
MPVIAWVIIGAVLTAFFIWRMLIPNLDKIVDQAVKLKDLGLIDQAIKKRSKNSRPTLYNHAVRRMWDSYQRPMAIDLVKSLAENFPDSNITQYWIKQILSVEPGMAKESFSKEFLSHYYKPEVAAQCGQVG